MSMWTVDKQDYVMPPEWTKGFDRAPVPGWGVNPFRAGPTRVGVGDCGCAAVGAEPIATPTPWLVLAGIAAAGIVGYFVGGKQALAHRRNRRSFIRPL